MTRIRLSKLRSLSQSFLQPRKKILNSAPAEDIIKLGPIGLENANALDFHIVDLPAFFDLAKLVQYGYLFVLGFQLHRDEDTPFVLNGQLEKNIFICVERDFLPIRGPQHFNE